MRCRREDWASRHFIPNLSATGENCVAKSARSISKSLGSNSTRMKKQARFLVSALVRMQDVAIVAVNEVGNGRDFALAIRTRNEQDGGVLH